MDLFYYFFGLNANWIFNQPVSKHPDPTSGLYNSILTTLKKHQADPILFGLHIQ